MYRYSFDDSNKSHQDQIPDDTGLIKRIEAAFNIYKISEIYAKDVADDCQKLKTARHSLDFAHHELVVLLDEAREKGIRWQDSIPTLFFLSDSQQFRHK